MLWQNYGKVFVWKNNEISLPTYLQAGSIVKIWPIEKTRAFIQCCALRNEQAEKFGLLHHCAGSQSKIGGCNDYQLTLLPPVCELEPLLAIWDILDCTAFSFSSRSLTMAVCFGPAKPSRSLHLAFNCTKKRKLELFAEQDLCPALNWLQ